MNIEDILRLAHDNLLTTDILNNFFNENPKEFRRNNRFTLINELILSIKDNSKLFNLFFDKLQETNKIFYELFSFMYLENNRNFQILHNITGRQFYFPIDAWNIILESLCKFTDERTELDALFFDYLQQAMDRDIDDFLSDVRFEFVNDFDIAQLYKDYPVYLKEKLTEYLNNNPNVMIYANYSKDFYLDFSLYANRIYYNGLSHKDIRYMESILEENYGVKRGFKWNIDCYKKIWDYWCETKDKNISLKTIEFLKNNLYECLTIDFSKKQPEVINIHPIAFKYLNDILEKANKANASTKFIIDRNSAKDYYGDLLNVKNPENVIIDFNGLDDDGKVSLTDYIRSHKFYDATAELINRFDFSPFEKYIFAYYLTTILRKYRYYRDDEQLDSTYSNLSRDEYYIIYGDYIVCAGYVNYLIGLLTRVGLKSSFLTIFPPEVKQPHARVLVHIVDSKYAINGVYIGDPTFDSPLYLDEDISFLHAFETKTKENYEKYQNYDESAFDFYSAMSNLGLSEELCDFRNEAFFDIINRPISNDKKIKALENVFSKIHPDYTNDEIQNSIARIANKSGLLYYTDKFLNTKCIDADNFFALSNVIEIPNVHIRYGSSTTDNSNYIDVGFMISIDGMDSRTLMEKLGLLYLGSDVYVVYSEYHGMPIINFHLDNKCIIKDLIKKIRITIKKIMISLGIKEEIKNETSLSILTSGSLMNLMANNPYIAKAIVGILDCPLEDGLINLYLNGNVSSREIALLMKNGVLSKERLDMICNELNISPLNIGNMSK